MFIFFPTDPRQCSRICTLTAVPIYLIYMTYNSAGNTYLRYQTYICAREPHHKQRDDNENDNNDNAIYQHSRRRWLLLTRFDGRDRPICPRSQRRTRIFISCLHSCEKSFADAPMRIITRIRYVSGIYLSIPRVTHVCVRVNSYASGSRISRVYIGTAYLQWPCLSPTFCH